MSALDYVLPGAGLLAGIWGGNQSANAADRAVQLQAGATDRATEEQRRQFGISQNNMSPWLRSGEKSLAELMTLMGLGGDTDAANRSLLESPEYRFAEEQGRRQLEGGLASRGGMGSGKAMTGALEFGQNLATKTRSKRLSDLFALSGTGRSAASDLSGASQNYANNLSGLLTGNANAQGAAGIAGANARQSGLLGGAQLGLNLYDYMNRG